MVVPLPVSRSNETTTAKRGYVLLLIIRIKNVVAHTMAGCLLTCMKSMATVAYS